jgi:ADP-ribosyl-[dinitrogen reductase] hydrolase
MDERCRFLREAFQGILLGTAVGDALGLPTEGLSSQIVRRLTNGNWKHRFLGSRGMWSDDTEHTFLVAQALLANPATPLDFQRALAWKLRAWLLGLPAGIGFATLRAILKLWLGFSPDKSGVNSAGNGPAMRSAIIGAFFHDDLPNLKRYLKASTTLTHTSTQAEVGAEAIALAIAWKLNNPTTTPHDFLPFLAAQHNEPEWNRILAQMRSALDSARSVSDFATDLGLAKGVSGYIYHTVPVALYAWLRHHGDFYGALKAALDCGGDTDTVGAITGALAGASVGRVGIPKDLVTGLLEWPRSTLVLDQAGERLANLKLYGKSSGQVSYFWPALLLRNWFFLLIVLLHGIRRVFLR